MHTHSMQKYKSDGQVLLLKVLHSSLADHPLEQVARHTQLCVCACMHACVHVLCAGVLVVCVVYVHACLLCVLCGIVQCVCVRACVRASVRACVHTCVHVCV